MSGGNNERFIHRNLALPSHHNIKPAYLKREYAHTCVCVCVCVCVRERERERERAYLRVHTRVQRTHAHAYVYTEHRISDCQSYKQALHWSLSVQKERW